MISNSPEETVELGQKFGSQLRGGEVVAVCGPLGSGKTYLIKGIAAGAGAKDRKSVTSPTFVIINEYKSCPSEGLDKGRLDIFHIDAYRLNSIAEFEQIGFDDFCYPQSVVLIEWADKIESALGAINCIRIELSHRSESQRDIRLENIPEYIDC